MIRPGLLAALLLTAASTAAAQESIGRGVVLGTVVDDLTGQPVPGARVDVLDLTRMPLFTAYSDDEGRFRAPRVRKGAFTLRVAAAGYRSVETPRWFLESGETLQVEVSLAVDAVPLSPLRVVASRRDLPSPVLEGFRDRMASGVGGHFITRAEIEARRPGLLSDMLATVPGVHLGTSGRGNRRTIQVGRASQGRDCPTQIYVDGFLINRRMITGADAGFTLDDAVHPASVEGIEVYRGVSGVPAEFMGPEAHCGVVVIWTRRGEGNGNG